MTYKEMLINMNALNQTHKKFTDNKTLIQLFEEQVATTPNNIAMIFCDIQLTYQELNDRANQLANYILANYKIKPDDLIVLMLDRSEKMLIAILAVLKVGAAYVPIEPNYPDDRISHILNDTKAYLVLTNQYYKNKLALLNSNLDLFAIDKFEFSQSSICNPKISILANNLAYVIYTSGTTGIPKGVMIEHKSVINFIYDAADRYKINKNISDEVILQFTNYVFDPSVEQMWLALLNGHKLLLIPNQTWLDMDNFYDYLNKNKVTHIHATPTFLSNYDFSCIPSLKRIVSGGEVLTQSCYKKLQFNKKIEIINKYGPTESTVDCLANVIKNNDIRVGGPRSDVIIYILDDKLNPVTIGQIGELYIGGGGLARGYLNLPELTAKKFVANPFQTDEEKLLNINARIYKTGDKFRHCLDGKLDYIGRDDFQIKLGGYRIELAEIEHVINDYVGILQSIVIVNEHTNQHKYLVGYYVSDHDINAKELMQYLKNKLPGYMIPAILTKLDKMPSTVNGKLDRKALPKAIHTKSMNTAVNDVEKIMCNIWSKILGIKDIDTQTSFFDLGGTSLLALSLKGTIEKEFNVNLNITDIFTHPSVSLLCKNLLNKKSKIKKHSNQRKFDFSNRKIAVISTSGAFADANNIQEYWDIICNGDERVTFLAHEQLARFGVSDTLFNQDNFVPVAAISKDMDKFDPEFWKISPKDAKLFDPQIRKFLEHSWIALEQSGYIKERQDHKIGVFAGMGHSQYYDSRIKSSYEQNPQFTWETTQINNAEYLATRISYLLGLTGPAINVSTACSTSLVAIIEACKNLFLGDCDMAVAGGAYFNMPEYYGHLYQDGMVFSKDGHCKPFDKEASGIIRGSGVGVVVLKRLDDAIRDSDSIMAIISGYAINNDGNRKIGYSAPSVTGQAECILSAQQMAGITSNQVSYVECHGTGTKLGDPIEVSALHEVFSYNADNGEYNCILGSVKANMGHAITASGVAGFIKVCKMLQTKIMPPQINFSKANPHLQLEKTNFRIITEKGIWNSSNKHRIAGVSSLGVGGTNAHIILEESVANKPAHSKITDMYNYYILPISAKSINSYQQYAITLAEYLTKNHDLNLLNVAYTLCKKRENFPYRGFVTSNNITEAISMLHNISSPTYIKQPINDIIFMFPGQGNQYTNMGYHLYINDPIFATTVNTCCKFIMDTKNVDFKEYIYPRLTGRAVTLLEDTKWSQLALFIIGYALAKYLESIGIKAVAYIGHSIGEYVAATLSGVFSLHDALRVVIKRGELMQQMPNGKMISVNTKYEEVQELLTDNLNISVINAPNYLVVSGPEKEIKQFAKILLQKQIPAIVLHTSHAFHSSMMAKAATEFEKYLHGITLHKPTRPFISNVTGDFISDTEAISPAYWAKQICSSVQFSFGIKTLDNKYKNAICLEIGPGKSLSTFIKQHNDVTLSSISLLPTAKEFSNLKNIDDMQIFYSAIGKLWSFGYDLNWDKLIKIQNGNKIELPGYQFQKNRYWIDLPKITKQDVKNIPIVMEQPEAMTLLQKNNLLIDEKFSSIERTIAICFSEVLGINEFSKDDSYFDLGGNSLSAIRLINLLNKQFKIIITMQIILQNSSVAAIANYFSNLNIINRHKIITKLNNTTNKPILFMIHPSEAGCEVYLSLAKSLEGQFSCYGVDSYNLYNSSKISSINKLAEHYLAAMTDTIQGCNMHNYNILGWSLGGQIALEMAAILETRGIKNIILYLLDTFLNDESLRNMRSLINLDDYKKIHTHQAITDGYDKLHTDRIVSNIDVDYKLIGQNISSTLQFAKALLFKAGTIHNRIDTKEYRKIQNHIISLPTNNLESIFVDKNQLKVVTLNNAHHWNIIKQDHLLIPEILQFK